MMNQPKDSSLHSSDEPNMSLLDAAIDSVIVQMRGGERPDIEALVAKYPAIERDLREVFPALMIAGELRGDSIDGTQPPRDAGLSYEVDRELLYCAFAFQCGVISLKHFLAAYDLWHQDPSKSIRDILKQLQALAPEAQELLDRLYEQQLSSSLGSNLQTLDGQTHAFFRVDDSTSTTSADFDGAILEKADGRFEFVRPLDRGGLGIVSVALDKELNREVALKAIRDDRSHDPYLRQRFLMEAQVTGGLEHPGIIPIYAAGTSAEGNPYYAMRLIRGNNLLLHLRRFHEDVSAGTTVYDGTRLRRLLRRFIDVCNAIEYAHSRGVLHRDIKPVNIMLGRYGETLVVDWGLAKALGSNASVDHEVEQTESFTIEQESPLQPSGSRESETRLGSIVGTPAYASPEQLTGQVALIGTHSDVYGLGATLYEVLCGQAPLSGKLLDIVRAATSGKISPPAKVNSRVPLALDAVCRKAMALDPTDRYGSVGDMRAEVERWLDDMPVIAYPEPLWMRVKRLIRKNPTIAATATVSVLMATIGLSIIAFLVTKNNAALANINGKLDTANTELVSANIDLKDLNQKLGVSNRSETQAKVVAQQQSELALSTLNAVILDLQESIANVPGGANVRKRLLVLTLPRLEKVANEVVGQSSLDRSTMKALCDLGNVVVSLGTNEIDFGKGRLSNLKPANDEAKSAVKIALVAYLKAHEIATNLIKSASKSEESVMDILPICFALSNLHIRAGDSNAAAPLIDEAVQLSQELVKLHPENLNIQREAAMAQTRFGEFQIKTGKIEVSLESLNAATESFRDLVRRDQNNVSFKSDLATGIEYLADTRSSLGDRKSASDLYQEMVEIRREIYEKTPLHALRIRNLIIALGKWSDHLKTLNEIEKAIEPTDECLRLCKIAIEQNPDQTQPQSDLANNLDRRAGLSVRLGKTDEAVQYYEESMAVRQNLVDRDPNDTIRKRDLSLSQDRLSRIELNRGNFENAQQLANDSLLISRTLFKLDPRNTMKARDVALSLISVGKILMLQGKSQDALIPYQESLDLVKKLSEEDPQNVFKRRDLWIGLSLIANVHSAENELEKALELYLQQLAVIQQVADEKPDDKEFRRDLGVALESVADIYQRMENVDLALRHFEACVAIRKKLAEQALGDTMLQSDLSSAYRNLGMTYGKIGRVDDAAQVLRNAIDIMLPLCKADANNLNHLQDISLARMYLGLTLTEKEDFEEAISLLRDSQQGYERLLAVGTDNEEWNRNWVEATMPLIALENDHGSKDKAEELDKSCIKFIERMREKGMDANWCSEKLEELKGSIKVQ